MTNQFEDTIVQSNINGTYTKRRTLEEHQKECLCEANHRKIQICDVIYDIDAPFEISKQVAYSISKNLLKDDVSHSIWCTTRSFHIHSSYDLVRFPKDIRRLLRMAIMREYALDYWHYLDKAKASENTPIRLENSTHEVTGGKKTMMFEHTTKNPLNKPKEAILRKVLDKTMFDTFMQESLKFEPVISPTSDVGKKYADFLNYCQKARFDQDGGRSMKLFKNIAIAGYRLGLSKEQMNALSTLVGKNSRGKKLDEVFKWWQWCGKQKHALKVNWNEVEVWYRKD